MTLSKDEELFLSTISAEEFEKTFNEWIEHMEQEYSAMVSVSRTSSRRPLEMRGYIPTLYSLRLLATIIAGALLTNS